MLLVTDLLHAKGHDVATIAQDASVRTAVELLRERGVGALVVSADGATIGGIISERDVVRAIAARGDDALAGAVADLMTTDVHTCTPRTTVGELMSVMTERRFRHCPVVVEGELAGMISIGDVVRARVEELEQEAQQLSDYIATGR